MNDQAKTPEEPAPKPAAKPAARAAKPTESTKATAQDKPAPPIRPVARPVRRGRHRRLVQSFIACVLVPTFLIACYMGLIARDRYTSTIGFTVRSGNSDSGTSSLLGGLATFTGTSASGDSDILNQFIRSQQMVTAVNQKLDLHQMYSDKWWLDPVFSLLPNASIEDMTSYWARVVKVSYDSSTGLMEIEVNAFSPEDATKISSEILEQSQLLINAINDNAHRDAIRYAQDELTIAQDRLKQIRTDVMEFRTRTRIVDIQADVQGRMSVLAQLQGQLSQEQVALRDLISSTRADDPRIAQAQRRIDALNARIDAQRNDLAQANSQIMESPDNTTLGYPEAISQYEALQTDMEFAQKSYVAAMAALDAARMSAMQQNRYLATYIQPTVAQDALYPQRLQIIALSLLFLSLIWGIGVMVLYSVREHS